MGLIGPRTRVGVGLLVLAAVSAATEWETELDTARSRAVQEGKLLFIEFTTDS